MEAPFVSARAALNCTPLADTVVFNRDGRDPSRETTYVHEFGVFFVSCYSKASFRWMENNEADPLHGHGLSRYVVYTFK
jgi:hypothetical protein